MEVKVAIGGLSAAHHNEGNNWLTFYLDGLEFPFTVNIGICIMQRIARCDFGFLRTAYQFMLMAVLTLSLLFCSPAQGQSHKPFTQESLKGQYALVGNGGNNTAASIGIETYDGKGNVTRNLILNESNADHERTVVTIKGQGTYNVQPNGMGTAKIVNTLPDGSTFTSHLDFVITQANTSREDEKMATEVFAILRERGIAATLVTFVLKRLPD